MWFKEILVLSIVVAAVVEGNSDARRLSEYVYQRDNPNGQLLFDVYRFQAEAPQFFRLWETVQVVVNLDDPSSDFKLYQHSNLSEVENARDINNRFVNLLLRKVTPNWNPSTYLFPFKSAYVGVETTTGYEICIKKKNLDYRLALLFLVGMGLLLFGKRLSRSATAFYAGGTALGVIGSLAIVVIIIYRFAPKKSMAVTILLGGWSVVAYVIYVVYSNMFVILSEYYRYVAVYFVSMASISFGISYYWGPPKGVRTLNLVQWSLQFIGLVFMYFGCQIPEVAAATIVITIFAMNLPRMIGKRLLWIRYRLFPPKRRLLTEDEYITEGARETQKALDDLRKYCQSPKCDSWKTLSTLKTPTEFAEFVNGRRSHISDDEVMRYSNESFLEDLENAEDDEDDEESNTSSSTYDLRSTPARVNYSFGGYDDQRNGTRHRYFTSFNSQNGATPMSAPPKLTRNGKFSTQ